MAGNIAKDAAAGGMAEPGYPAEAPASPGRPEPLPSAPVHLSVSGDIGPATGNVRYSGKVRVSGSVRTGFQLFANGDATIAGSIEASLVSSEGTIVVGEGVKGANRGTLRAKKTIVASFAEQARLLAVEDIRVRASCVFCDVKTNGRLLIAGDKGALVGGICHARMGVDAAQIGSENGVATEISFGQDYLVADMIEAEEREVEKLKSLIVEADHRIAGLGRAGGGPGLDALRQDKVKLLTLLEKRSLRLFDLREKFEEHHPSEIRVRGTIFPGVVLESHNRRFVVKSRRSQVVFSFDPQAGRIVESPL